MLAGAPLTAFRRLDNRVLIALDGTEHSCSFKIQRPRCPHRRRVDGGEEYFHSFLGASLVAPGHAQVLLLAPEFITPQDGAEKQDCERNAAKRWLARNGRGMTDLRPVYLGDDLFASQLIVAAIAEAGRSLIPTHETSSHQTVSENRHGVKPEEHHESVMRRGKREDRAERDQGSLLDPAPPAARGRPRAAGRRTGG